MILSQRKSLPCNIGQQGASIKWIPAHRLGIVTTDRNPQKSTLDWQSPQRFVHEKTLLSNAERSSKNCYKRQSLYRAKHASPAGQTVFHILWKTGEFVNWQGFARAERLYKIFSLKGKWFRYSSEWVSPLFLSKHSSAIVGAMIFIDPPFYRAPTRADMISHESRAWNSITWEARGSMPSCIHNRAFTWEARRPFLFVSTGKCGCRNSQLP